MRASHLARFSKRRCQNGRSSLLMIALLIAMSTGANAASKSSCPLSTQVGAFPESGQRIHKEVVIDGGSGDADGVLNGSCDVSVRLCFGSSASQPSPCAAASLSSYALKVLRGVDRANRTEIRQSLLAAVAKLSGASVTSTGKIAFSPPASLADTCIDTTLQMPIRTNSNFANLKLYSNAVSIEAGRHRHALLLKCLRVAADSPPVLDPRNLAPNPSFETDPFVDYFSYVDPPNGRGTLTTTTTIRHSGGRGIEIASDQPSGALARWLSRNGRISAREGRAYEASIWVKTRGVAEYATLEMNFWDATGYGYLGSASTTQSISGTTGWGTLAANGTAPAGTASLRIEVRLHGPGTVWADDVFVRDVSATPSPGPSGSTPVPAPTPSPIGTPIPTRSGSGRTYYLSPNGSDANSGTSAASPWRTFGKVFNSSRLLLSGDTLVLLDGTYTPATTGLPNIDCTTNANVGMQGKPITIRAQNERRALLASDGSAHGLALLNCSWWNVEGIFAKGGDSPGTNYGSAFQFYQVSNVSARRLLGANSNRYANVPVFDIEKSRAVLVEECEAYGNQRAAFLLWLSRFVTLRRCYANSLHVGCPAGGTSWCPANSTYGDSAFSIYGSSDSILENCVAENDAGGITISGADNVLDPSGHGGRRNQVLGTILLNDNGVALASRGKPTYSSTYANARDNVFRDIVVANGGGTGVYLRSAAGNLVDRATIVGMRSSGLVADETTDLGASCQLAINTEGCGFTGSNVLVANTAGYGMYQANQQLALVEGSNSYGNGGNFAPSENLADTSGWLRGTLAVAPTGIGLGANQCLAWVPSGSNMKGAGKNGADIGANILYRYQDGSLTSQPLWDRTSGAFPCGAIVAGVNDGSTSCSNVHTRLNINRNGCDFPTGY